jgi:hypothetical protein
MNHTSRFCNKPLYLGRTYITNRSHK